MVPGVCAGGEEGGGSHRALVTLKDPKTSGGMQYLVISSPEEGAASSAPSIHELNVFSPSTRAKGGRPYAAWFAGDSVIQDGSLYIFTPVHINFLLIPALEKIHKDGATGGSYCGLDHVVESMECDGSAFGILLGVVGHAAHAKGLSAICDVKACDGAMYVKLCEEKLLAWLKGRVERVCGELKARDPSFGQMEEGGLTRYALGMVCEYLSDDVEGRLYAAYGMDRAAEVAALPPVISEGPRVAVEPRASRAEIEERKKQQLKDRAKLQREEDRAKKRAKEVEGIPKISSFFKKKK